MNERKKNWLLTLLLIIAILGVSGTLYFYNKSVLVNETPKELEHENEKNESSNNEITIDYDFEKLFKEAEKLYTAFTYYNYSMKLDTTKCVDASQGRKYCLVNDTDFNNYNNLKLRLEKIFGESEAKSLLNKTVEYNLGWDYLYKNVDGKTYRLTEIPLSTYNLIPYNSVNSNIEKIVVHDSLVILKNKLTVNTMASDGADTKVKSSTVYYILEKDSEGNWIFNNYISPMQHMWDTMGGFEALVLK